MLTLKIRFVFKKNDITIMRFPLMCHVKKRANIVVHGRNYVELMMYNRHDSY